LKRNYSLSKYKRYAKRHGAKGLKRKLAFKKYLKRNNKKKFGIPKPRRTKKRFGDKFGDYFKVHAPEKLSFIDNPNEVVEFIALLKYHFDKRNKVFVVLKNVTEITYDTIVVLLSIMVKFKASGIDFNGDFPDHRLANKVLNKSQFILYLYKEFKERDRYDLGQQSSIHTHAWKDVDAELGSKLIEQASKTVWGEVRRCQGIQRTLIELMLNTNNHADDSKKREKHWWLSVHHNNSENKVSFAFIDFGIGVFTSLNNKRSGSRFFGILKKLKEKWQYGNNSDLLKLIMDGTLHKTATGKPHHGKGLPCINMALQRNQISNLNIITNDVYANIDNNVFKTLPKSFSGTFVYWELNKNNVSCNDSN